MTAVHTLADRSHLRCPRRLNTPPGFHMTNPAPADGRTTSPRVKQPLPPAHKEPSLVPPCCPAPSTPTRSPQPPASPSRGTTAPCARHAAATNAAPTRRRQP